MVFEGDTVILYGRSAVIAEIGQRPEGSDGQQRHDRSAVDETRRAASKP